MKKFFFFYLIFSLCVAFANREEERRYVLDFQAAMQSGNDEKALKIAHEILAYIQAKPFSTERETTRLGMYVKISEIYLHMGKKKKALFWLEKLAGEKAAYIYPPYRKKLLPIFLSLAKKAYVLKKYDRAVRFQKQAYVLAGMEKTDTVHRIQIKMNLGVYLMYQGSYAQAISLQSQAVNRAKKIFDSKSTVLASMYDTLALSCLYAGRLKRASRLLHDALDMKRVCHQEDESLVKIYNHLASLAMALESSKKALVWYQKAITLLERLGTHTSQMFSVLYTNTANAYVDEGNFSMAEIYYKKSCTLLGSKNPDVAYAYSGLASLAMMQGREEIAEGYIKKAIETRRRYFGRYAVSLLPAYIKLAELYIEKKKYRMALGCEKKAEAIVSRHSDVSVFFSAELFLDLAYVYDALHQEALAYRYAERAWKYFLRIKESVFALTSQKEKIDFKISYKHFLEVYLYAVYRYVQTLPPDEGQHILKKALVNWTRIKHCVFEENDNFRLLAQHTTSTRVKKSVKALFSAQKKLAKVYENSLLPGKQAMVPSQDTAHLQRQIRRLETYLSAKVREEKIFVFPQKRIDVDTFAQMLDKETLYIDFIATKAHYCLFTLNSRGNVSLKIFDTNETKILNQTVRAIEKENKNIASKKTFPDLSKAYKAYGTLFSLLHQKIDFYAYHRLIVSKDGVLDMLPFEALYDRKKQKFLLENMTINYLSSAKGLLSETHRKANTTVTVFADPDFGYTDRRKNTGMRKTSFPYRFTPLPGTRKEAEAIASVFPQARLFLEENASEENLLEVDAPSILHIATHGFFESHNSIFGTLLQSGIVLSGGHGVGTVKEREGIVNGLMLAGLSLRGTDLVVLSSCYSGMGEVYEGEGLSGLSYAFKRAGTQNVLVSLWAVNDVIAERLMHMFYTHVAEGVCYAEALREAKRFIYTEGYIHPYYWGGFIMNGLGE